MSSVRHIAPSRCGISVTVRTCRRSTAPPWHSVPKRSHRGSVLQWPPRGSRLPPAPPPATSWLPCRCPSASSYRRRRPRASPRTAHPGPRPAGRPASFRSSRPRWSAPGSLPVPPGRESSRLSWRTSCLIATAARLFRRRWCRPFPAASDSVSSLPSNDLFAVAVDKWTTTKFSSVGIGSAEKRNYGHTCIIDRIVVQKWELCALV